MLANRRVSWDRVQLQSDGDRLDVDGLDDIVDDCLRILGAVVL